MTDDWNDWNTGVIADFRAHGGRVGGQFEGAPLLLLHTKGAKSGRERVNPLMYRTEGNSLVIFGSKAGAPTNPDWYHNLRANPPVAIQIGTETSNMTARIATGDERSRLYDAHKDEYPTFAEYEKKTKRAIPVIILEPAS